MQAARSDLFLLFFEQGPRSPCILANSCNGFINIPVHSVQKEHLVNGKIFCYNIIMVEKIFPALFAGSIGFEHPITGKLMDFNVKPDYYPFDIFDFSGIIEKNM